MAAAADRAEQPNIGLIAAASVPDSDPCDIACEALPARVAGDLGRQDQEWLLEHADDCNYCANELRCYDVLDEALEAVGKLTDDPRHLQPPPLNLPRRDRVWYVRSDSPLGELILAATPEGLREIEFGWRTSDRMTRWQGTITGMGFRPRALPTARVAPGLPMRLAMPP